jgi:dTDP-4-dehydrorhamnose 3,5-epimerase-like enzyme
VCTANVELIRLADTGDQRGSSFPLGGEWLQFLGRAVDCHVMTVRPGQVRGNHYHAKKREILIVVYKDRWSLCWDNGPATEIQRRSLTGSGAAMVKVEPLASHAIVNDGQLDLFVMALCSEPYDPSAPDSFPRMVAP